MQAKSKLPFTISYSPSLDGHFALAVQPGLQKVAPCHCTGERVIAMFADEFCQAFIHAGVGKVIALDNKGEIHENADN
jgi:hypothetical protein